MISRKDQPITNMANEKTTTSMENGLKTIQRLSNVNDNEWKTVESKEQRQRRRTNTDTAASDMSATAIGGREQRAAGTGGGGPRAPETGDQTREIVEEGRSRPGRPGVPGTVTGQKGATSSGERAQIGGVEKERERATAGERQRQQQEQQETAGKSRRIEYDRELTVSLELTGNEEVQVLELMRAIRALCGGLIACRATGARNYEVTMSHVKGKERLLDGFKIGSVSVLVKDLCNDELMVSFLSLPAYITDEEILQKLEGWGVSAASAIRRRMWPGTQIADGTRFLKVKFTDKVQSLPYSARFETAMGPEYFRVIHDRQAKVCRMCLQPGHILRECPEFSCHKCGVQGHYARECSNQKKKSTKCEVCCNPVEDCMCNYSESEAVVESGSEELYSEAEDMSEEEEKGEEAGEGGSGTADGADREGLPQRRAPIPPKAAQGTVLKPGVNTDGLGAAPGPHKGGRGKGGDGLVERPEPTKVPESMEVGETPNDLQPAAAAPLGTPASSTSVLRQQGRSDSDSEMDFATVKNIRKQHTSNKASLNKRRKKDKKNDG